MIAPPPSTSPPPDSSPASRKDKAPKIKRVRLRTPPVLQMEAVECGAAALSIVMAHFGKRVPLEEMRIACGVSRDGSKASNIVKAARTYNMEAKGYRKEPHQLREMPLPLIVFWEFNHFLVVEGWSTQGVYLNDPAMGPRFVTHEEFDKSFTGVALVCRPGEGWMRGGESSNFLHALSTRLRGSKSALWFVVLAGLGLVLPGLALPIFSKIFVDNVLVAGIKSWVAPLLVGLMLTAVLRAALTSLQQKALLRLETKLSVASSSRFFWHLLHLPVEFYTQRSAGELAQRVAINDRIASLLSGQLATNALGVITAVFFLFLMARYDPILTLVALVSAALNIAALAWVSKRRTLENQKLLMETGKVMGTTVIGLQLIESLKAGGLESDFYARWAGFQAKASNSEARLGVMTRTLNVVPPLLAALNTALVLGVGGVRVMGGDISVGTLVAFQTLMVSFLDPVNRMVALASSLQEAQGDMQRIDDVLRYPQRASSTPQTQTAPPSGHIELRDVSFGYSRLEAPLIEGFNLSLKPGSRVALVGGSGSGKSTIARLVCGLNQPWSGKILFDGAPRESWPDHIWSGAFSVVDQEIFLFSGSVHDNLTLWDNTVPEADMVQATHDACIHDAIASRPHGYNSMISEGGSNFSGGQRQRLEIARALVTNPSIVILDEATSALDSVTEKIVDDNLRRRGCTCLIIAHRLSTIRDCDEIVVLQKGKVVQRGTHENMMRENGPYKTLISAE